MPSASRPGGPVSLADPCAAPPLSADSRQWNSSFASTGRPIHAPQSQARRRPASMGLAAALQPAPGAGACNRCAAPPGAQRFGHGPPPPPPPVWDPAAGTLRRHRLPRTLLPPACPATLLCMQSGRLPAAIPRQCGATLQRLAACCPPGQQRPQCTRRRLGDHDWAVLPASRTLSLGHTKSCSSPERGSANTFCCPRPRHAGCGLPACRARMHSDAVNLQGPRSATLHLGETSRLPPSGSVLPPAWYTNLGHCQPILLEPHQTAHICCRHLQGAAACWPQSESAATSSCSYQPGLCKLAG